MKISKIRFMAAGLCLLAGASVTLIRPATSQNAQNDAKAETEPAKSEAAPIAVTFSLAQNVSGLGRVVAFSLTARNTSKEAQTLVFNSGQNFEITATPVKDNIKVKEPVWRWSNDRIFTAAVRNEILQPGESKTWSAVWQGENNLGNPAPRGQYSLEAFVTANGGLKAAPLLLDVRAEGIREVSPGKNDLDAGLNAKLETDKTIYKQGESVQLTLTLKNESGQTTALMYPSGQQYDMAIRPAPKGKLDPKQKIVWQWSAGRAFTMMLKLKQFAAGETLTYSDRWDLKDNKGQPLPPGKYVIESYISANRGIAAPPVFIEIGA